MSNLADPSSLDGLSRNETVKVTSNHLRGLIKEELLEDTPAFGDDSEVLLKFHGIYQQDDRDRRKEARAKGLDRHHQLMIRTRIPGGVVSADAYIAHDDISQRWANGTLRVTTRQDFQLHGVLKGDIKKSIRGINDALLTTLGGCGDVERNITAEAAIEAPATLVVGDVVAAQRVLEVVREEKAGTPAESRPKQILVAR